MWAKLAYVFVGILVIKGIFLALDPTAGYFFGDSESYLATATTQDWIPPDRSFLYGFLIRLVAYNLHCLESLIYLQAFCSAVASWLLCFALVRYFSARLWIAATFGILCAVEPLQLLMERYVMTEAVSNFLFAVHFVLLLAYVRRGNVWTLLTAQAVGVLSIGIRISFLPEVLVTSVLAPMISPQAIAVWRSIMAKLRGIRSPITAHQSLQIVVHLASCLLVNQTLLTQYRHWNGRLSHREGALLYESGNFLLSDFAPLIEPEDFPIASKRDAIFNAIWINLRDPQYRPAHHFMKGGLWESLYAQFPNDRQANQLATATAIHALLRRPASALKLSAWTFASYFNRATLDNVLRLDERGEPMSGGVRQWLRQFYGVRDPKSYQLTITKKWHLVAAPWYWIILCALVLSPSVLFAGSRENLPLYVVCVVTALLFLEGATLTVDRATPRFLTTDAWLVLLMFGTFLESLLQTRRQPASLIEQSEPAPTYAR